MRGLQFRVHQTSRPQSSAIETPVAKMNARLQTFAAYGALLLIAGIVFGALPFRPF